MPPRNISSGTIPKSTSRPQSRHNRSRGPPPDVAIEEVPEQPIFGAQTEAPQEPARSRRLTASRHPRNEDVLQAAAKACTELTAPIAGRVNDLKKAIPSLLVTNEDAFARLATMEALLDKAIKQPADVVQDGVTLWSDVNRIHELSSVTARSLARIEQALAVRREIQEAVQVARYTATVKGTLNDTNKKELDEDLEDKDNGDGPHNIRSCRHRSQSR